MNINSRISLLTVGTLVIALSTNIFSSMLLMDDAVSRTIDLFSNTLALLVAAVYVGTFLVRKNALDRETRKVIEFLIASRRDLMELMISAPVAVRLFWIENPRADRLEEVVSSTGSEVEQENTLRVYKRQGVVGLAWEAKKVVIADLTVASVEVSGVNWALSPDQLEQVPRLKTILGVPVLDQKGEEVIGVLSFESAEAVFTELSSQAAIKIAQETAVSVSGLVGR